MRRWLVIVPSLALATGAPAQAPMLDLSGGATPPAPGSGAAALLLAQDLKVQAEALERADDPASRARAAIRRLARALVITGEGAGAPGSTRVLLGRTLADGMADVDAMIGGGPGPGSLARLQIIERDALAGARVLEAPGADPYTTLRDALAFLTDLADASAAPGGWPPASGQALPEPPRPAGAAQRPAELDGLLDAAESWNAYRPAARRLGALWRAAGGALEPWPDWVPAASRQAMADDFARAARGLLEREERSRSIARLERLGQLGRLAARADMVADTAAGQRIRTALAQHMGAPAPDPALDQRTLDAFELALELALALPSPELERTLVRQLRPAWRSLSGAARQDESRLLAALPALLRRTDTLSDPGIVATLNSARRAMDDLNGLLRLSETIGHVPATGREPEARPEWARVAARALKLGQDLGKPALRAAALESLRTLMAEVDNCAALPAEDRLTHDPAWDTLTGGRGAALHEAIQTTRIQWIASLEKGETGSPAAARLGAARLVMLVLGDAVAIDPASLPGSLTPAYRALQSWPGWQLSGAALAELAAGLPGACADAARLAVEGDAPRTSEAVVALRRAHAAALLAGRLARRVELGAPAPPVVLEVGGGGPWRTDWMSEHAASLATICRYAEEIPVARRTGAESRAEAARAFVDEHAARVLDAVP